MTIILEHYPLPSSGRLHLNVTIDANINVTADEAQKAVSRKMLNEVSYLLWAETPSLVVSQRTAWRVPIYMGLVGVGRVGPLGIIDVDVETGEIQNITPQMVEEMKQRVQNYITGSIQKNVFDLAWLTRDDTYAVIKPKEE